MLITAHAILEDAVLPANDGAYRNSGTIPKPSIGRMIFGQTEPSLSPPYFPPATSTQPRSAP
jgi:hypothetical protein